MAYQFDLVSPERRLASVQVTEVQLPGAEGDLTAMEGHLPTITTLRPGIVKAVAANGVKAFVVTGGFADITATTCSVLAEQAIPVEEVTAEIFAQLVEEVRVAAGTADQAAADKAVADIQWIRGQLGL